MDEKLKLFFEKIQKIKKNEEKLDLFDFLKGEEIKEKETINRLLDFKENISNFRIKDKYCKSKFNFLSPIKFKTKFL